MALNIKNVEVEHLATEVARKTGETKTQAIRKALEERNERLDAQSDRKQRIDKAFEWLEKEVWPTLPPEERGRRMTKDEVEKLLGYGPDGV